MRPGLSRDSSPPAPWNSSFPAFSLQDLVRALLIVGIGLWAFAPAYHGGWVWDDDVQITDNKLIQQLDGGWKAWLQVDPQGDYYPLTAFVRWVEWQTFGQATLGYHLVNVGLHLASALLLWRLLARLAIPGAWLGGLIFAIYPVNVESVAWLTELKNALSLPPLLLAMITWLEWRGHKRGRTYAHAIGWFAVSMLAKTAGMMLPFVLLVHAWWKDGKITRRDLEDAAPFFAITVAFSLLTALLQPHHVLPGSEYAQPNWQLAQAVVCAGWTALFLLGISIVPANLLPIYPGFADAATGLAGVVPWLVLAALVALLWCARGTRWGRHLLFGFGFFLLNLVPVLVFVVLRYKILVWSLDHLLYLPSIGLIALASGGIGIAEANLAVPWRTILRVAMSLWVALLAWTCHERAAWYRGAEEFWTRTLQAAPGTPLAEQDLAVVYMNRNDLDAAWLHAGRFLALSPDASSAHELHGVLLEKRGHKDAAEAEYRVAIALLPGKAAAYLDLGEAQRHDGQLAQAEATFRAGLQHEPDSPELALNLANALSDQGKTAEALQLFERANQLNPESAELQYDYASALLKVGNLPAATRHLAAALELNPDLAAAHENLGAILAQLGHLPEAIEELQRALSLDPTLGAARVNLARALVQSGRVPEAIAQFQKDLEYHPDDTQARDNLARLQQFEAQHPAAP